jgi:hypothetical protein
MIARRNFCVGNFFPRAHVLTTKLLHETHTIWIGGEITWQQRKKRLRKRSKLLQLNQDGAILPSWFVFYGDPHF